MKLRILCVVGVLIALLIISMFSTIARATCVPTPNGAGGQDVVCDGVTAVGTLPATFNDDNVTVNGPIQAGTVYNTFDGNDTFVVNGSGSVDTSVQTGNGDDTVTNNGGVGTGPGDGIITGAGDDSVTNTGTVNGDILTGADNDNVTLSGSTVVVTGTIDGGAGTDTLTFNMSTTDYAEYEAALAALAAANPAGGTLIFNGQTYTWTNFEQLVNLMTFIGAAPVPRLNDVGAPVAIFCNSSGVGGIDVYTISPEGAGVLAIRTTGAEITGGLNQVGASGQNSSIASGGGATLWALTSGELQVNVGTYAFTFSYEATCGPLPEQGTFIQQTAEDGLPGFTIINRPR